MSKLREALGTAFVDEVLRVLKTLQIRGWVFDTPTDVGIKIANATPLRFNLEAHIDQCTRAFTINQQSLEDDLGEAVERLVVDWFAMTRKRDVLPA